MPNQTRTLNDQDPSYIPDTIGSIRIGNFLRCKHPALSGLIAGRSESLYINYPSGLFKDLLSKVNNGLRIYFATYKWLDDGENAYIDPSDNNINVPDGFADTMTLILAPTKDDGITDTGDYYILSTDSTSFINLKNDNPLKNIALLWVKYHNTMKYKILTDILQIQQSDDTKKETQCLLYNSKAVSYLKTVSDNVDTITVFFATYHLNDNFPGQLTLVFSAMNKYEGHLYYKNSSDTPSPQKMVQNLMGLSGDTGVPCPPPPPNESCGSNGALLLLELIN